MLFIYLFIYNSVLFPQRVWVRATCHHYHHIIISGERAKRRNQNDFRSWNRWLSVRVKKKKSSCGFPNRTQWNNKIKQNICQIWGQEAKIHFKKVPKRWEMNSQIFSALLTQQMGSSKRLSAVWSQYNRSHIWSFRWGKSTSRNGHRWIFAMCCSRSISPAWEV